MKKNIDNKLDNTLEKLLLLKPLLDKISDGGMFKIMFIWFFRVIAALLAIGILYASWQLWSKMSNQLPAKYFIGALLLEVFIVIMGYTAINIVLIRANTIRDLPNARDYLVTPIVVVCWKMFGEILGSMYILLGLAIGIISFVAGENMMQFLPFSLPGFGGGTSSGLFVIILGAVFGFLTIFIMYFLAEAIGALVDIARNTQKRN